MYLFRGVRKGRGSASDNRRGRIYLHVACGTGVDVGDYAHLIPGVDSEDFAWDVVRACGEPFEPSERSCDAIFIHLG